MGWDGELNNTKRRVSLTKLTGRRGICGYDPSDPDLVAQIKRGKRSNLVRRKQIGRPGRKGRVGAAARYRRRRIPRRRGSGLAGVHQNRCSGGRLDPCLGQVWPARYACCTWAKNRVRRGSARRAQLSRGSAREGSPEREHSGYWNAYRP